MKAVTGGDEMIARKQSALVGLRVRFREPLRKKLEVAAKKRGVSLNAELVDRLERSFSAEAVEQVVSSKLDGMFERYEEIARAIFRKYLEELTDEPASEVWRRALKQQREKHIKQAEKRHKEVDHIERVRQRFEKEMQVKHGHATGDKS
jgi:ABC-type lipopolysaccharide export system ATPase subunit